MWHAMSRYVIPSARLGAATAVWEVNVLCSRSGSSLPAVSQTHYTHHSKKVVQSGGAKSAQAGGGCTGARPNARKAGAPRQQLDDDEGPRTAAAAG